LTVGALPIKNLLSQARQLATLLEGVFILYERARPPKESETLMEPGMVYSS
jgi:hypothetical protein